MLIGGLVFLKNWIIRSETSNALGKLFLRNPKTNEEEEIVFSEEKVIVPSISLIQRDKVIIISVYLTDNQGLRYLCLLFISSSRGAGYCG